MRDRWRQGLRKALTDVLGDLAVIQRCQVHKLRNARDHLPKKCHAYVIGAMREAYKVSLRQDCVTAEAANS